MDIYLRKPKGTDLAEVIDAYQRSIFMHAPWTSAPKNFLDYLKQNNRYFVCLIKSDAIVGTFHISEIVRGCFHSAYLGYEAFAPYQNQGYMTQGMQLIIKKAFKSLNLHRLEANIQPRNIASIALVAKSGFLKEGVSPAYLYIDKEWKTHEHWVIINNDWVETS